MIEIKEAYCKVLKKHPNEFVHVVNEFKDNYAFLLLNKGEIVGPATFFCDYTVVNKETGNITEEVPMFEDIFQGDFKQYTREELERL